MQSSKTSNVNRKRMIYKTSELEFRIYLSRRKVLAASYILGRQPEGSSPTVREGAYTERYALDGTPREMLARGPHLTRGLLPRFAYLDHVNGATIFVSMSVFEASRCNTGYLSPSP